MLRIICTFIIIFSIYRLNFGIMLVQRIDYETLSTALRGGGGVWHALGQLNSMYTFPWTLYVIVLIGLQHKSYDTQ